MIGIKLLPGSSPGFRISDAGVLKFPLMTSAIETELHVCNEIWYSQLQKMDGETSASLCAVPHSPCWRVSCGFSNTCRTCHVPISVVGSVAG
jgi:hypothetical protein